MDRKVANLLFGKDLGEDSSQALFKKFFLSELSDWDKMALLGLLARKGENAAEIVGLIHSLRPFIAHYSPHLRYLVDVCGTGGDRLQTFNISTVAAFIVAAGGGKVAKHGNRSISSRCGSSDLMEALGINIEAPSSIMLKCLRKVGIAYLHAPLYNRAMQVAQPVRKQLGIRTIFNFIGPLVNPFEVTRQIIGLSDNSLLETYAKAMRKLNFQHAVIVHGTDGLDEITTTAPSIIVELKGQRIRRYRFEPKAWGIKRARLHELRGGCVNVNRSIALGILQGKIRGPKRDIVCLNAAFGLYVSSRASSPYKGWCIANEVLDKGEPLRILRELKQMTAKSTRKRS